MAKNQNTTQEPDEEVTLEITAQETPKETTAKPVPYDPWKDMRTVFIPKMSRTEQSTLEVGVNDKTYFIPKEKMVEVPEPVWEVVEEMIKRRKQMEDNAKKNSGVREFNT